MALNPLYVLAPSPQVYFVDKDTGLPLAGGELTFYSDLNRTDLKPVYELTGTPPNYTYTALPNPMTLSSVGTMMDGSNNDIIPYYYPYDEDGNIELYYITWTAYDGAEPQAVREGWPNVTSGSGGLIGSYSNLIPNGQFLMHQDVYNPDITKPNQISEAVTVLGQGGWTFERDPTSTAVDIITFNTVPYTTNPTGNPRFQIEIQNTSPGMNNTYKDLRKKFQDVNKFSTPTTGTRPYRIAFTASSNASGTVPVEVILIKNFGTDGGSAQTETTIFSPTIALSDTIYQSTFSFGTNSGQTIGPHNNDFIQLAIRFPVDNLFDVTLTDFILMVDEGVITSYPNIPQADDKARGIAGWMPTPAPDGSDNYLPLRLTPAGMIFDSGEIGQIIMESNQSNYTNSLSTLTNNMLADGSMYLTTGYSPLRIPYSRLQQYYFDNTLQMPIYGTGENYLTAYQNNNTGQFRVTVNKAGVQTAASDGAGNATTFTFNPITTGVANFGFRGFANSKISSNTVIATADVVGTVVAATAGTTTFTVSMLANGASVAAQISIATVAGSSITGGQYFPFSTTTVTYYIWFKVGGVGTDPAPGGTGILINILSTTTAQQVCDAVATAIDALAFSVSTSTNQVLVLANEPGTVTAATAGTSGFTVAMIRNNVGTRSLFSIATVAATSITAGHYFMFFSVYGNFYMWFKVNGSGTDPAPGYLIASASDAGIVTAATAGTTAFTVTMLRNNQGFGAQFSVATVGGSAITGGQYFTFSTNVVNYYIWFQVDGVGVNPAPGGTGILVSVLSSNTAQQVADAVATGIATTAYGVQNLRNTGIEVALLSTFSAQTVGQIISEAMNGFHADNIIAVAGSVLPAGSFFNITANSVPYYVWYKVQGAGTDPAPVGKTAIAVEVLTADTAAIVMQKTQLAINSVYFAAPDFRGVFFRGFDPNNIWDLDSAQRWSFVSALYGNAMGTFEFDTNLSHTHTDIGHGHLVDPSIEHAHNILYANITQGGGAGQDVYVPTGGASAFDCPVATTGIEDVETGFADLESNGGSDGRPINAYANYVIKY